MGESSGYFEVVVMSLKGDKRSGPANREYVYIGVVDRVTAVKVDGVSGTQTAAHLRTNPGLGPEAGTTQILYNVYNGKRTYLALYQHRPKAPDYSAVFNDLMQHSFWLSPWNGYHSLKWGYSVDYPANWYDLGDLGAPDTEKFFANDKKFGSPIALDASGIFFALSAVTGPCRSAPPGNIDSTAHLTVDGRAITRVSGFFGALQSEVYWGSYAAVPKGTKCFGLAFFFGSKPARDGNLRITDEVISSFSTS